MRTLVKAPLFAAALALLLAACNTAETPAATDTELGTTAASCNGSSVIIPAGTELGRGEEIRSCNGRWVLRHQEDGNVILYAYNPNADTPNVSADKENTSKYEAFGNSNTAGRDTSILRFQPDGNLVLYNSNGRAEGNAIWDTGTNGVNNPVFEFPDNGLLAVFRDGQISEATRVSYLKPNSKELKLRAGWRGELAPAVEDTRELREAYKNTWGVPCSDFDYDGDKEGPTPGDDSIEIEERDEVSFDPADRNQYDYRVTWKGTCGPLIYN